MTIAELAAQTKLTEDYLLLLKAIHDGTEPSCSEEESEDIDKLADELAVLDLE